MAWKHLVEKFRNAPRPKKDPLKKYTEGFICKFNKPQMDFIRKNAEFYGSKANVIRNGLNLLMKYNQKDSEKAFN